MVRGMTMMRGTVGEVKGPYIPSWLRGPDGNDEGVDALTGITVEVVDDPGGNITDALCLTDDKRAWPYASDGQVLPCGRFRVHVPRGRIRVLRIPGFH